MSGTSWWGGKPRRHCPALSCVAVHLRHFAVAGMRGGHGARMEPEPTVRRCVLVILRGLRLHLLAPGGLRASPVHACDRRRAGALHASPVHACDRRHAARSAPQVAPALLRKAGGATSAQTHDDAEAAGWRAGADDAGADGRELRQRSPKLCDDSDLGGGNATIKSRLEKLCGASRPPRRASARTSACARRSLEAHR